MMGSTSFLISAIDVFFSTITSVSVTLLEDSIVIMGWIPSTKVIVNPTAVPAIIAAQEQAIYLINSLSDQIIDGIDAATNEMRTEKAAPSVPYVGTR